MAFFEFPHTRTYNSDLGWLIHAYKVLSGKVDNIEDTIQDIVTDALKDPTYVARILAALNPINVKYPPVDVGLTAAIGDGVADDTEAITGIIAYAYENSMPIIFPAGTYVVSGLTVTSPITFIGMGGTLLLKASSVNPLIAIKGGELTATGLVFNGNIAGQPTPRNVITVDEGSFNFDNCTITGGVDGISGTISSPSRIVGCDIDNFTQYGIYVEGTSYINAVNIGMTVSSGGAMRLIRLVSSNNVIQNLVSLADIPIAVEVTGDFNLVTGRVPNADSPYNDGGEYNSFNFFGQSESVSYNSDIVYSAENIRLSPENPLGYKNPIVDNQRFKHIQFKDENNTPYNLIVEGEKYSDTSDGYTPWFVWGLIPDGTTDNSGIADDITNNTVLTAGTYLFNTNVTINASVMIPHGAVISVPAGVTLSISEVIAGRYNIFTGDGTVKLGNSVVYPEWFGAVTDGVTDDSVAIQDAINAIDSGVVSLRSGSYIAGEHDVYTPDGKTCYRVSNTVELYGKSVMIEGVEEAVIFASVLPAFEVGNTTAFTERSGIKNCMIYFDGTQPTGYDFLVRMINVTRCSMEGCRLYNCINGLYINGSVNININHNEIFSLISTGSYATGYGIYIVGGESTTSMSPNASMVIEHNIVSMSASIENITTRYGIFYTGSDMRDAFIRFNDIAGATGIYFDGQDSKVNFDIHIVDNVVDQFQTQGIRVANVKAMQMEIVGGYYSGSSAGDSCISLENCNNVSIVGAILQGDTMPGAFAAGVLLQNCYGIVIDACIFFNDVYAVRAYNSDCTFANCSIVTSKNSFTTITSLGNLFYCNAGSVTVTGNRYISDADFKYGNYIYSEANTFVQDIGNSFGDLTAVYANGYGLSPSTPRPIMQYKKETTTVAVAANSAEVVNASTSVSGYTTMILNVGIANDPTGVIRLTDVNPSQVTIYNTSSAQVSCQVIMMVAVINSVAIIENK